MAKAAAGVALAATLSGCGDLPLALEYTTHVRTRIDAPIAVFDIKQLDVYESPKRKNKIWVEPTTANGLRLSANGQGDKWVAMRSEVEPVYRQAGSAMLAQKHPGCSLTTAVPIPDFLAIEFDYSCP